MEPKSLKDAEAKGISLSKLEVYDIIRDYIQEQIELSNRKRGKEENFFLPAWSEYQAFHLGTIKGLERVLEYIPTLTKGK